MVVAASCSGDVFPFESQKLIMFSGKEDRDQYMEILEGQLLEEIQCPGYSSAKLVAICDSLS